MKKYWWISALLVLSFIITACGALERNDQPPSGEDGTFPEATADLPPELTATADGAPVEEGTATPQPLGTPAGVSPFELTPGDVLNTAILGSSLLVYDVAGQDGQVGQVRGLVIDMENGRVRDLVVGTVGPQPRRESVVPWGAFQVVALPPADELAGAIPAPVVWLNASSEDVQSAPEFNYSAIEARPVPADWDADARAYWNERLPEIPVTAEGETVDQPAIEEPEEGASYTALVYVQRELFGGINFDVENAEGQHLGDIRDIVIGQDGEIAFGLLRTRAFLGMGADLIPVSWQVLTWMPEEEEFLLNATPEMLNNAPRFDRANLPDMTLPGWEEDWRRYWDELPTAQVSPTPGAAVTQAGLASDFLGQTVTTRDDQVAGELVDWEINPAGQADFALVEAAGQDGRVILVPWVALGHDADTDTVRLNATQDQFEQAPVFAQPEEENGDVRWREEAVTYWGEHIQLANTGTAPATGGIQHSLRASEVLEREAFAVSGTPVGRVVDLVLDPNGQLAYFLVNTDGQLRPVPWSAFDFDFRERQLNFIDDEEMLAGAPAFNSVAEMPLDTSGWDAQVRTYWGMQ
jgi:sporulation protein YlmC with PRC-barrel domain